MPGAGEVGGVGGSLCWELGSSVLATAAWELRSMHSSPRPAVGSVLSLWISFSSVYEGQGVGSGQDYFKGSQHLGLPGFIRPEFGGENGVSGTWGLALGLHYESTHLPWRPG